MSYIAPVARATPAAIALPLLAALALASCTPGATGGAAPAPPTPAGTVPTLHRPAGVFAPGSMTSVEIAPGVTHVELDIPSGPWLVHIVAISPTARDVVLRTVKGLDRVVGRERPSEMARRTAAAARRELLAAVNADFFEFNPPGVSEGPQVSDGHVVKSEGRNRAARTDSVLGDQPVFGVTADGRPFFADAHLDGGVSVPGDVTLTLRRVNRMATDDSLTLYDSFRGDTTPSDSGVTELVLRIVRAAAMAGDTAEGVVASIDTAFAGVPIPSDGAVLALPARAVRVAGRVAGRALVVGDTIRWWLPFSGAPPRVRELVGGYPMLLRDGRRVVDSTAAIISGFSATQHPRTAVATLADGSLLLLAVDGRNEASKGMSLTQLTDLLVALGAVNALNLDGGGSTVMVVRDSIVSHPSDREGERAVANALVVWR